MSIFGWGKTDIMPEEPENNEGKLTARIEVEKRNKDIIDVYIVAVEQDTGDAVFRLNYADKTASGDYSAYTKARELLDKFAMQEDYILNDKDVMDNIADTQKPVLRTIDKRMR